MSYTFQYAEVLRKNDLLKITIYSCRTHLTRLQLPETIGKDIQIILGSKILQHFFGMGHQAAFGRNNGKEIFRETFSQSLILHSYCL